MSYLPKPADDVPAFCQDNVCLTRRWARLASALYFAAPPDNDTLQYGSSTIVIGRRPASI